MRGDVRAFESDLGEAVLGDLHGGASLLHLLAQILHLGDGQAGIVGHDDHPGGLEDLLEDADELLLFRSIHGALSGCGVSMRECRPLHLPHPRPANRAPEATLGVPVPRVEA